MRISVKNKKFISLCNEKQKITINNSIKNVSFESTIVYSGTIFTKR